MSDEQAAPLSAEELAAIRERVEQATPGPWMAFNQDSVAGASVYDRNFVLLTGKWYADEPWTLPGTSPRYIDTDANMRFIAASRTDVPRLLATVEALQARILQLEGLMRETIAHDMPWARQADGDYFCTYCGAISTKDQPSPHLALCPWVLAKQKLLG